jgi:hypothetical protein
MEEDAIVTVVRVRNVRTLTGTNLFGTKTCALPKVCKLDKLQARFVHMYYSLEGQTG